MCVWRSFKSTCPKKETMQLVRYSAKLLEHLEQNGVHYTNQSTKSSLPFWMGIDGEVRLYKGYLMDKRRGWNSKLRAERGRGVKITSLQKSDWKSMKHLKSIPKHNKTVPLPNPLRIKNIHDAITITTIKYNPRDT